MYRNPRATATDKELPRIPAIERLREERDSFYVHRSASAPDVGGRTREKSSQKSNRKSEEPKMITSVADLFLADSIRGERQSILVEDDTTKTYRR